MQILRKYKRVLQHMDNYAVYFLVTSLSLAGFFTLFVIFILIPCTPCYTRYHIQQTIVGTHNQPKIDNPLSNLQKSTNTIENMAPSDSVPSITYNTTNNTNHNTMPIRITHNTLSTISNSTRPAIVTSYNTMPNYVTSYNTMPAMPSNTMPTMPAKITPISPLSLPSIVDTPDSPCKIIPGKGRSLFNLHTPCALMPCPSMTYTLFLKQS